LLCYDLANYFGKMIVKIVSHKIPQFTMLLCSRWIIFPEVFSRYKASCTA